VFYPAISATCCYFGRGPASVLIHTLVVRSVDDALLAAIQLHDLPAPDDEKTPRTPGAGCPVPPAATNVSYGPSPQNAICPPYDSAAPKINRR
jgi:hypothetical protein